MTDTKALPLQVPWTLRVSIMSMNANSSPALFNALSKIPPLREALKKGLEDIAVVYDSAAAGASEDQVRKAETAVTATFMKALMEQIKADAYDTIDMDQVVDAIDRATKCGPAATCGIRDKARLDVQKLMFASLWKTAQDRACTSIQLGMVCKAELTGSSATKQDNDNRSSGLILKGGTLINTKTGASSKLPRDSL